MSPRRAWAVAGAFAMLVSSLTLAGPGAAQAVGGGGVDAGAVSVSKTVTRVHLQPGGTQTRVDSKNVTLRVDQTKALHSRQPIRVSWSGARPTAGIIGDPNSAEARQQEYPFMLVECRGVDSSAAAPADRIRPETCWTGSSRERVLTDRDTGFGPWRLDRYETPANRKASVGIPSPFPAACDPSYARGERWLHFRSVKGTDYAADGSACPSVPPETSVVGNANQPPNTTYAATQPDGTGSTKFTVWTSEDNASLGCAGGVRCTLVAIPIMGISCDVGGRAPGLAPADRPSPGSQADKAAKNCEATGAFRPGESRIGGTEDAAVSGEMWFSESNWRNRISVPLDFAPLSNVCDIVGGRAGVDVYGSELVAQLTAQWRPVFCLDPKRSPFKHVQIGEPQAANLLKSGTIDAGFLSNPPKDGYAQPTVTAPVSLTGFAISYAIDDANRSPYRKLRLTPRLIAKLLTQSYPGIGDVKKEYQELSHNPLDLSQDPEFIALNPGIRHGVPDSAAASTLLDLSSDSDVVHSLTSYLAADREASAWLDGAPDPWGMRVNPNYSTNPVTKTGFALPVNNWPLRDSFEPKTYYASGVNACLQADPVPILPLIAAPTARLANIALALQFASSSAQIVCNQVQDQGAVGAKLVAEGRQNPGFRFVIGLTSLGDARRYDLDTAALQTYIAPSAPAKMADGTGRSFAAADDAGLRSAAKVLTPDDAAGTWRLPYGALLGQPANAGVYPGSMLVSLAAPTLGRSPDTAKALSALLAYAAGPGQVSGLDLGQLPPGYLPLTAANGLGAEQSFTVRAAAAVAAQRGALVPLTAPPAAAIPAAGAGGAHGAPRNSGTASSGTGSGTGNSGNGGSTGLGSSGGPSAAGSSTASSGAVAAPVAPGGASGATSSGSGPRSVPPGSSATLARATTVPVSQQPVAAVRGLTGAIASALAARIFPLMLGLGLLGLLTAAVISRVGRPQGQP